MSFSMVHKGQNAQNAGIYTSPFAGTSKIAGEGVLHKSRKGVGFGLTFKHRSILSK